MPREIRKLKVTLSFIMDENEYVFCSERIRANVENDLFEARCESRRVEIETSPVTIVNIK